MGRRIITGNNPKVLNEELEKKRKSDEMSECCEVMGSSSFCKEQQLLEAAAFHLILLSNPLQQSYDYNKGYDSDDGLHTPGYSGSLRGGFRRITSKKKKKKTQDHGVEGIVKHENDKDANSVTSSASSSSAETLKSEISSVSMEENEVEDNKGTAQRLQQHRLRSIVDLYHVTSRL